MFSKYIFSFLVLAVVMLPGCNIQQVCSALNASDCPVPAPSNPVPETLGYHENPSEGLAVQNGKILIAAKVRGGTSLSRYFASGDLDPSFGTNGVVRLPFVSSIVEDDLPNDRIKMLVQSDDKIILAKGNQLIRLLSTGQIDATFNKGQAITVLVSDMILDHTGRILAMTSVQNDDFESLGLLARYNSDGSADASFGDAGSVILSKPLAYSPNVIPHLIVEKVTGQIVAATESFTPGVAFELHAFTNTGKPDLTWGTQGEFIADSKYPGYGATPSIALQKDGSLILITEGSEVTRLSDGGDAVMLTSLAEELFSTLMVLPDQSILFVDYALTVSHAAADGSFEDRTRPDTNVGSRILVEAVAGPAANTVIVIADNQDKPFITLAY